MKLFKKKSGRDTSDAVTVDWVVLCAAIVGLIILVLTILQNSPFGLVDVVSSFLTGWAF